MNETLVATGLWKRHEAHFFHHMAELAKVMVHPRARGMGLGALVTRAVMDNAAAAGIETLQLGFREWGRLPNVIEVGDERFDDVRMSVVLGRPGHLDLHGRSPTGPGASSVRRGSRIEAPGVH